MHRRFIRNVILGIFLGCGMACVLYSVHHILFPYQYTSSRYTQQFVETPTPRVWYPTETQAQTYDAYITPTPMLLPPFPDFSKASAAPRANFDINTWQEFSNDDIGLRFKYPPDWGTPNIIYGDSVETVMTGWELQITFSNSKFQVNGRSSDFSSARDGSYADFTGFHDNMNQWTSAKDLCDSSTGLIFCQPNGNYVHLLSGASCGQSLYGDYSRVLYINRLGEKHITGFTFGGIFISGDQDTLYNWFCDPGLIDSVKQQRMNDFNQAVLDRKLNIVSMKNFDEYEKVFETIQTY